jgi:hypothetical protein
VNNLEVSSTHAARRRKVPKVARKSKSCPVRVSFLAALSQLLLSISFRANQGTAKYTIDKDASLRRI